MSTRLSFSSASFLTLILQPGKITSSGQHDKTRHLFTRMLPFFHKKLRRQLVPDARFLHPVARDIGNGYG